MNEETTVVVDIDGLRRAVAASGGDEAFVAELTAVFTSDLDLSLSALLKALTRGDEKLVRKVAHRIKGGAAAIRATPLRLAAEALERASEFDALSTCAARVEREAARARAVLLATRSTVQ